MVSIELIRPGHDEVNVVLLVRDSSRVRGNRFLSKLNPPSWILSSTQDVRPASGDSSLSFTETKTGLQRSASHCAVWMFVISHETELSQNVTTTDSLALLKHQQELNSWREVQWSVRETLMFPLKLQVSHSLFNDLYEGGGPIRELPPGVMKVQLAGTMFSDDHMNASLLLFSLRTTAGQTSRPAAVCRLWSHFRRDRFLQQVKQYFIKYINGYHNIHKLSVWIVSKGLFC